jgi:sulfur relay (sulfurtransferase) DsrC/TusE family protein
LPGVHALGIGTLAPTAEGFAAPVLWTTPVEWSEELAEISREYEIAELTDRHRQVVRFMRETYLATGAAPSICKDRQARV